MPNKSDSAGKLHQYYTCKQIEKNSKGSKCFSPLDDKHKLDSHLKCFNHDEIKSLKKIGELSGDEILKFVSLPIKSVEDIGVSSGVKGIDNTDDLIVNLSNGEKISFSLKCAINLNQILSKNPGAKSLLKKYFNAKKEQNDFNEKMEKFHLAFFECITKVKLKDIKTARKLIKQDGDHDKLDKAKFSDATKFPRANICRDLFLNSLRDLLFEPLNNLESSQLANACNIILDTRKNHILAEYKSGKEKVKHVIPLNLEDAENFSIDRRGNDSVTIKLNDREIGFRFKFESEITGSIKLVGDYKYYR